MEKQHQFQLWVLVIIIAALALWTKPAKAANEYLQSGGGHCSTATLEPYAEIGQQEGTSGNIYPNSDNNNYGLIILFIKHSFRINRSYK